MEMLSETQTLSFHDRVQQGERALSYSQVACWAQCRHKWLLQYGLGIAPLRPSDPMALGSAVHEAIAYGLSVPQDENPEEQMLHAITKYRDVILASLPYDEALSGWGDDWTDKVFRIAYRAIMWTTSQGFVPLVKDDRLMIEQEFQLGIPGFDYFGAHLDVLLEDPKTGAIWLTDFKVRASFSSRGYERTNLQHIVYTHVAREHGIPVTGTLTVELKNDIPSQPKLNKSGEMSRSAIATDWPTYKQALVDASLNPDDYEDMQRKLEAARFLQPLFEARDVSVVKNIWTNTVLPAAQEIASARDWLEQRKRPPFIWRNMRWLSCNGCPVADVCIEGMEDRDVEPILRMFKTRSPETTAQAFEGKWFS